MSGNNFTFEQDGATVAFLRLHVPEFMEAENWLPNSQDLSSVDYSIWLAHQQHVYHSRRIRDAEHLKEVLQTCWEQTGQDVIDRTWRNRTVIRSLLQQVDTLSSA